MKILYITMHDIDINQNGIYSDLINELLLCNHKVTVLGVGNDTETKPKNYNEIKISMNVLKRKNRYIKGMIATMTEFLLLNKLRRYGDEYYDLIIYATPPIMFTNLLRYCKRRYKCKTYLMLKDIFPQNAIDEGILPSKGPIYNYFKKKEIALYYYSDCIGCMSPKNIEYVTCHNEQSVANKLQLFPNTEKIRKIRLSESERVTIRKRFGIPSNKVAFIFGGNLGIAQAIDDLVESIKLCEKIDNVIFIIVGSGTKSNFVLECACKMTNLIYMDRVLRNEYEKLVAACDVGIISLSDIYTIPNYPSRMLTYFQCGLPVLAATDNITDVRELIENNNCGMWSWVKDYEGFYDNVKFYSSNRNVIKEHGENAFALCKNNFSTEKSVEILESFVNQYDSDLV